MADSYEETLKQSFTSMHDEQLIERKMRGQLTPEAETALESEMTRRGISEQDVTDYTRVYQKENSGPVTLDGLELATPGIRLIAQFLDQIVGVAIYWIVLVMTDAILFGILAYAGYVNLNDAFPKGQSLGKKIMGIKTVDATTHQPCTLWPAFKRNVTLAIPIVGFIDMLMIFGRNYQRWGDRFANTVVVKNA